MKTSTPNRRVVLLRTLLRKKYSHLSVNVSQILLLLHSLDRFIFSKECLYLLTVSDKKLLFFAFIMVSID